MARRRTVFLLLLTALVAGCEATPEPSPRPAPPEIRSVEHMGGLKAATWQAAADLEAERLRLAIKRARASKTITGALRFALLTNQIRPAVHARHTREYNAARAAIRRLDRTRAAELGSVLTSVKTLASQHLLEPSRLRAAFLVLRRNTEFWTHRAMPAAGQRVNYGAAVFQYYPGRGMQLQPLASWGRLNWLARACLRDRRPARGRAACPARELRDDVDALLALAAHRGDFLAWEHYFSWGGGTPPWISGMTQATAVSALARASRALGVPRWRKAAHRALGAFEAAPPLGVNGGDHFLMYSFSPGLRVFNGELQAVSGVGEFAALWPDRRALRLFRRAEPGARAMVAAADTGAWSLYSFAGREATLGYHRLIEGFLGDMCRHTGHRTYCDAHVRFARYEREPTRIGIAPFERLRARHATSVRFRISKVSSVKVQLYDRKGLAYSRDMTLPYGTHQVGWTPPARGRYRVRIEAQGPSGPVGMKARSFRVVLPKPKPQKKKQRTKTKAQEEQDAASGTGQRGTVSNPDPLSVDEPSG